MEATGVSATSMFGGVGRSLRVKALLRGVDVWAACPGRLLDLMGQGHADLSGIEITVIDEADHMADMGFLPMVTRILAATDRKSTRLNSSHVATSYAVFCLKKKKLSAMST